MQPRRSQDEPPPRRAAEHPDTSTTDPTAPQHAGARRAAVAPSEQAPGTAPTGGRRAAPEPESAADPDSVAEPESGRPRRGRSPVTGPDTTDERPGDAAGDPIDPPAGPPRRGVRDGAQLSAAPGPHHGAPRRGAGRSQVPEPRADLPPRHAAPDADETALTVVTSPGPRHALGEECPSPGGPADTGVPAQSAPRRAPRLRLAYQAGVPVVAVAALMAVQAFTPAPSTASTSVPEAGDPLSVAAPRAGTTTAPGTNADGSLPLSGRRIPGALLTSTRSSLRANLGPAVTIKQLGRGECPVGGSKAADCNQAIAFMVAQMTAQSHAWHNQCLALVGTAYGGIFQRVPRAIDAATMVKDAGGLRTAADYRTIPRGSLLWFASAPGQLNQAGHVAIAVGGGMAISNDVPFDDGRVGVVPISYFTARWGKIFLGYSSPADSRNA